MATASPSSAARPIPPLDWGISPERVATGRLWLEAQASRLECLVGRRAPRVALASARGMARPAAEALARLCGLRDRLRRWAHGPAGVIHPRAQLDFIAAATTRQR